MEDKYYHLQEGPEGLHESCDLLLSLDDGSEVPVHSQVLARCSPVFHGMLKEQLLSKSSAAKKTTVPFGDCSLEVATSFLLAIYSLRPHQQLNKETALTIARLGDKYGVKVCTLASPRTNCGKTLIEQPK